MENNNDVKTNYYNKYDSSFKLVDLIPVICKKIPMILICCVICACVAFIGTKYFVTPKYTAETKVYVLNNSEERGVTTSDLQVGSYLTKDYMELVKSKPVLKYAIKKVGVDISVEKLRGMISLSTPSDTRILCIRVTHTDPELAKELANAIREQAGKQICEIMKADAVNIVEEAETPNKPSSPNIAKNTVLCALLGMIVFILVISIRYFMDDTIKTSADIEKYLGITTLTAVPVMEKEKRKRKKK